MSEESRAGGMKVSQLNRLQRSGLAASVAAVSKDSTVGASNFLGGVLREVDSFIKSQLLNTLSWKVSIN